MPSFYVSRDSYNSFYEVLKDPLNWMVSIGAIAEPMVIHFKTQPDLLAYLHGHQSCLSDERIKNRYKEIERTMNDDVRTVIIPAWKRTLRQKIKRLINMFLEKLR